MTLGQKNRKTKTLSLMRKNFLRVQQKMCKRKRGQYARQASHKSENDHEWARQPEERQATPLENEDGSINLHQMKSF